MGIQSALYSGVSGLNTNSQAMSVIGNNLANTNTIGFKGARTVFSDLLSSTIFGSGGVSQVGRGVNVSTVDNVFSQGTFEATASNTDVAIEGGGFFMLKEVGNDATFYSRAGAFRFDDEGFLVNPEGYRVQGKPYDANGALIAGDPTDIQVQNTGLVTANVTTEMGLNTNLDASEDVIAAPFAWDDTTTFNYSASTQVYDTLGNPHLLTAYFKKTADNTWDWYWSAEDSNDPPNILGAGGNPNAVAGTLNFDTDGVLAAAPVTGNIDAGDLAWDNGSADTGITVTFDTTQFNSDSVVIAQDQNGFGAGNLTGVTIDEEGTVIASYSNGEQTSIAALVLSKFTNPGGLELVGSNLYRSTAEAGPPRTGLPGPELGKIFTNSLEQSNVDMGQQFVKMITVQRGFQANSKIITTVDELLGELINLKR
ncbi:MAG: flagellar hook protein FlgE [Thermodesulfobacteriota bacterium]